MAQDKTLRIENLGEEINDVLKVDGQFEQLSQKFYNHLTKSPLDHPDGSITAAKLADGCIIASKIPNDSITTEKIADGAITSEKLSSSPDLIIPNTIYAEKTTDGKDLIQQFADIYTELLNYYTIEEINQIINSLQGIYNILSDLILRSQRAIEDTNNAISRMESEIEEVKQVAIPDASVTNEKIENINATKLFTNEGDILILDGLNASLTIE